MIPPNASRAWPACNVVTTPLAIAPISRLTPRTAAANPDPAGIRKQRQHAGSKLGALPCSNAHPL